MLLLICSTSSCLDISPEHPASPSCRKRETHKITEQGFTTVWIWFDNLLFFSLSPPTLLALPHTSLPNNTSMLCGGLIATKLLQVAEITILVSHTLPLWGFFWCWTKAGISLSSLSTNRVSKTLLSQKLHKSLRCLPFSDPHHSDLGCINTSAWQRLSWHITLVISMESFFPASWPVPQFSPSEIGLHSSSPQPRLCRTHLLALCTAHSTPRVPIKAQVLPCPTGN